MLQPETVSDKTTSSFLTSLNDVYLDTRSVLSFALQDTSVHDCTTLLSIDLVVMISYIALEKYFLSIPKNVFTLSVTAIFFTWKDITKYPTHPPPKK